MKLKALFIATGLTVSLAATALAPQVVGAMGRPGWQCAFRGADPAFAPGVGDMWTELSHLGFCPRCSWNGDRSRDIDDNVDTGIDYADIRMDREDGSRRATKGCSDIHQCDRHRLHHSPRGALCSAQRRTRDPAE